MNEERKKSTSMKYFYDTEFAEDGRTIELISIGIVCEDGRELYLQSSEIHHDHVSLWVEEHVYPHLIRCPHITPKEQVLIRGGMKIDTTSIQAEIDQHSLAGQCTFTTLVKDAIEINGIKTSGLFIGGYPACFWRTREQIRQNILDFMDVDTYGPPELWAYYSSYDHVAFCQIFGSIINLPQGFPMLTYDLRQHLDMHGMQNIRQPDDQPHNALRDARWNRDTYLQHWT